jgi:hypothetical protein
VEGFEKFWSSWPKNEGLYTRKGGKGECLQKWARFHCEEQADHIVRHVEWLKTTQAWLKESGQFIPAPVVYLNQRRWDGADVPEVSVQTKRAAEYVREHDNRTKEGTEAGLSLINDLKTKLRLRRVA